ncbi:MAG TPA: hypothetical protein HA362_05770 [Nanoarchaeota archaeon]|nr:hypothetical protein [Nanoarchaeota archaeon]
MRKNPKLFTEEEYNYLHKVFMQEPEDTKLFTRIKSKRGVDLDLTEVKYVKKKYGKWRECQGGENGIFFVRREDRDF